MVETEGSVCDKHKPVAKVDIDFRYVHCKNPACDLRSPRPSMIERRWLAEEQEVCPSCRRILLPYMFWRVICATCGEPCRVPITDAPNAQIPGDPAIDNMTLEGAMLDRTLLERRKL